MVIRSIVIVGGGLAGASAAASLRKRGFDGRIVVLGDEPSLPYERPDLSKGYLRGTVERSALAAKPEAFYADNAIDVRTSARAAEILPAEQVVVLEGGERLGWDRLLIATGSAPRPMTVPGSDLTGIHALRTVEDADTIRAAAAKATAIAAIGGGWIGAEVAASLRELGHSVTLVARSLVPLERVLGREVGEVYRDLHLAHGTKLALNQKVVAFHGRGRVTGVELGDGSRIAADLVVVGIGATPRTDLASRAGLAIGDGIEVDQLLQTSVPGIYAAGDVASAWHPIFGTRVRVEHWDNAKRQGAAAAGAMLGEGVPYARVPYFFSDQFDLSMEYSGFAPAWDRVVVREESASGAFAAFWLRNGRLAAGMSANLPGANAAISALVAAGRTVDPARLADPSVALDDLEAVAGSTRVASQAELAVAPQPEPTGARS